MTTNNPTPERKAASTMPRRKRRSKGVPTTLVAALLVLALFLGGLIGVIVEKKTNTYAKQLDVANAKINELNNTLTMIGFNTDTDSAENWVFDDSGTQDEYSDLNGGEGQESDNSEVLWGDDSMLTGSLTVPEEPVVVAEFNGGTLMSNEVVDPYNEQLADYIFSGHNASEVAETVLTETLQSLVGDKILYARAEELGLTTITDEDKQRIDAQAQTAYEEDVAYYADLVGTDDMTADEKKVAAIQYMKDEMNITLESSKADIEKTWWIEKLFDTVTKDVSVTDTEIETTYNEMLAQQKSQFTEFPDEYEYAMLNGQTIVYNLENYRAVKHILLPFDNNNLTNEAGALIDSIAELDPATDMEKITEYQNQLNALYKDLETQANQILTEIQNGADFDEMIAKYGGDQGMDEEPAKTNGYYVSANSILWSSEFVEGCMMLEEVGQVSTPVRSTSGVHIIKYIANVTPGEVPLDQVYDSIKADVLLAKKEEVYEAKVSEWISTANVVYYPERLQ